MARKRARLEGLEMLGDEFDDEDGFGEEGSEDGDMLQAGLGSDEEEEDALAARQAEEDEDDDFDLDADPALKLGVFSTGPEVRSYGWNTLTEVIGTFVLVFIVLMFGNTPSELGPLAVAMLVVGIGASLGGPTGYAINPARDLGPRLAHFILPIAGKGESNWKYAWIPVVGPLVGGAAGGLFYRHVFIDGNSLAMTIALGVIVVCLGVNFIVEKRWSSPNTASEQD